MKVLITSDWYYPVVNGVVRSILNLKKYLEDQGHEVRVLTLSNSTKSFRKDEVYYIGSLGAGKLYPDARMSTLLRSKEIIELINWNPDIIHSQCEFSTFIMAKKISNKTETPILHTYHTVYEDYTHYFSPSKKVGKKIIATLSKAIAKNVDKLIVPSIKTKNILLSYGIKEDEIVVIPTGIQIDLLMDKKSLREKYGYKEDDKILLYLGRLAEEKNVEELIDFYQKIKMENTRFLIVGGGPYLEKLKKYANKIDKKIDFIGQVDPSMVKDYYQLADVFISASNSETQGLTYYEALSNGRIALCRKDACLDGVIKNNYNGYQYKEFKEFKDFLGYIFDHEDMKDSMEKNARTYALENFSIESFGKKCEDEYKKFVKV